MITPLLIDAHQDLAWNMLNFERDYTLPVAETRRNEQGSLASQVNGDTLLGWPEYQQAGMAVIFSTLFAAPVRRRLGEWDRLSYASPAEAQRLYSQELDAYERLVDRHPAMFRRVRTSRELQAVLEHWQRSDTEDHPVGLVVLMEGAEGIQEPGEVEEWYSRGVSIIGPAWAGTRFCGGTREPGGFTSEGFRLLERMQEFNLTLDLSHMDETAALQALDNYSGPIIASHANALALLKNTSSNRHLSDRVIEGLLEREATIGIVCANNFLLPGWQEAGGRSSVTLELVAAQMDYICQMAGNASHVGFGSDFDGGFGLQSVPGDVDSIADLRKVIPILSQKGYTEADISAILGGNWLAHLQRTLPEVL